MKIIGRIESNALGHRQGIYVLYLSMAAPEEVPIFLLSAIDPEFGQRDGWCEVVSVAPSVLIVDSVGGWYPVNGDVLIAAKMVPAPPPMMAVPE